MQWQHGVAALEVPARTRAEEWGERGLRCLGENAGRKGAVVMSGRRRGGAAMPCGAAEGDVRTVGVRRRETRAQQGRRAHETVNPSREEHDRFEESMGWLLRMSNVR